MEIEVQVSEAPDICAIIQGDTATMRAGVVRFERESGEPICYFGQPEFIKFAEKYKDDISASISFLIEEMKEAIFCSRYDEEIED